MSTNNKKSLASQALLEMEDIKKAIKEESKNTLKSMLSEAVKDALRESIEEEDEEDYEVEDEQKDAKSEKDEKCANSKCCGKDDCELDEDGEEMEDPNAAADPNAEETEMDAAEGDAEQQMGAEQAPAEGEEGDEWQNFSQYQVPGEENTYDLTNVEDPDEVVKVYKLLKDDDQVVVKKDGNKISLQDGETGNEYVIDLGGEEEAEVEDINAEEPTGEEGEENAEELNEGFEFEIEDDDIAGILGDEENNEDLDDEDYVEFDEFDRDPNMDDESEPEFGLHENNNRFEGKKSRKTMKESKETLFEIDLGYTDNYQSKDPIQGLSNNEPSKSGKSWEKGVPTGTEKPWAGNAKSKSDPFKGGVNEEDEVMVDEPEMGVEEPIEEITSVSMRGQRDMGTKKHIPAPRKEFGPKTKHHVSVEGDYHEEINETLKKMKKENKELKEAIKSLRKNLSEAYVTNVNLGKITKLFLENTTSQSEKVDIINRFSNEAKTVEQSQALFESINKDLKKVAKSNISEGSMTAQNSNVINEEKVYKSQDLLDTLDFIKRMENC